MASASSDTSLPMRPGSRGDCRASVPAIPESPPLLPVWPVRADGANASEASGCHHGELLFLFVLRGELELQSDTLGTHTLRADDCCTIPAGEEFCLRGNDALEMLEVALPA